MEIWLTRLIVHALARWPYSGQRPGWAALSGSDLWVVYGSALDVLHRDLRHSSVYRNVDSRLFVLGASKSRSSVILICKLEAASKFPTIPRTS